jgi:hypothetical protein
MKWNKNVEYKKVNTGTKLSDGKNTFLVSYSEQRQKPKSCYYNVQIRKNLKVLINFMEFGFNLSNIVTDTLESSSILIFWRHTKEFIHGGEARCHPWLKGD